MLVEYHFAGTPFNKNGAVDGKCSRLGPRGRYPHGFPSGVDVLGSAPIP